MTIIETDITPEFLQSLWDSTNICEECGGVMEDHCQYPLGRHLDHIKPLHAGGTHTQNNVRYIHAICNIHRKENSPKKFWAASENTVPLFAA